MPIFVLRFLFRVKQRSAEILPYTVNETRRGPRGFLENGQWSRAVRQYKTVHPARVQLRAVAAGFFYTNVPTVRRRVNAVRFRRNCRRGRRISLAALFEFPLGFAATTCVCRCARSLDATEWLSVGPRRVRCVPVRARFTTGT